MIEQNLVDKISLNFHELFIIEKYVKIRLKNRVSPWSFLCSKGILQKVVCILGFVFYGVSSAKADLHNKYII